MIRVPYECPHCGHRETALAAAVLWHGPPAHPRQYRMAQVSDLGALPLDSPGVERVGAAPNPGGRGKRGGGSCPAPAQGLLGGDAA